MAIKVLVQLKNGKKIKVSGDYPKLSWWLHDPANNVLDYKILPRDKQIKGEGG